jgi:hypothetical protein
MPSPQVAVFWNLSNSDNGTLLSHLYPIKWHGMFLANVTEKNPILNSTSMSRIFAASSNCSTQLILFHPFCKSILHILRSLSALHLASRNKALLALLKFCSLLAGQANRQSKQVLAVFAHFEFHCNLLLSLLNLSAHGSQMPWLAFLIISARGTASHSPFGNRTRLHHAHCRVMVDE